MKKYFLFMTSGISLHSWIDNGSFDREFSFIERLSNTDSIDIYIISYSKEDSKLQYKLPKNVHIILPIINSTNSILWRLNYLCWPFVIKKKLSYHGAEAIFRSNQISGSIAIFLVNLIIKGKTILRCGYVKSLFEAKKGNYLKSRIYKIYEKFMIYVSDIVIVSNENDRSYFQSLTSKKININRNYVINNKKPKEYNRISNRILFVGRLRQQKNLFNIIKACHNAGFGLEIIGDGPEYIELQSFVDVNNYDVRFHGNTPFEEISNNFYFKYKYCILCSYFEGTPKTLLEALDHECIPIANNQSINKAVPYIENYLPGSECIDAKSIQEHILKITDLDHKIPFRKLIEPFQLDHFVSIERELIDE